MANICIIHLVWKPLGLTHFREFINSYKRNPGGLNHRFVVAFNGFDSDSELEPYREALAGVNYESIVISPPTQDIPAYFQAAKKCENMYLCFLNSYSVILDADWLAKMFAHISRPEIGLVGATASWASHYSMTRYWVELPSAYDEILFDVEDKISPRMPPRPALFELSDGLKRKVRSMSLPRRIGYWFYYYGVVAPYYLSINYAHFYLERRKMQAKRMKACPASKYDPFPSFHVRTNAFIIRRDVMLRLKTWHMLNKEEAYRFESGKESMTNQVLQMGLKVLVVGRDGRGYDQHEWPLSETLWQGEQRNLMIADNQTRDYEGTDALRRTILSRVAWGRNAAPVIPEDAGNESQNKLVDVNF